MPLRGSPNSRTDVRWGNRRHFLCELLRRVLAELYTGMKRLTDEFPDVAPHGMAHLMSPPRTMWGRHHVLDQTPPVAVNGDRPGGWSGCGLARELVLRTQS